MVILCLFFYYYIVVKDLQSRKKYDLKRMNA